MTQFNRYKVLHRDTAEVIKSHFGNKLFTSTIPENIALAEAPSSGKPIFDYAPQSNGAIEYMKLTEEFLNLNL